MSVKLEFKADNVSVFKRFSWLKATKAWADEMGPLVAVAIREAAPVGKGPGSGRLKNSIRYRRSSGLSSVSMEFGSDVPYLKYVERGTPPHIIQPRNASVIRFTGKTGDTVFAHLVHHPGTKPNPFARNAVERMSPVIMRSFQENIEAQFRKV